MADDDKSAEHLSEDISADDAGELVKDDTERC